MRGIPIGLAAALSWLGAGLVCAQTPAREIWHSLEIPGGTAGLLQAAGLDPGLPRWQAFHEVTRRLDAKYGDGASASRSFERVRATLAPAAATPPADRMAASLLASEARGDAEPGILSLPTTTTVPLPMAPAVWSKAVFGRPLSDGSLALAILSDRGASLLYRGLVQLDPATLAALEGDPETLREVYRRHGEAFSVFAGSFHVRDGRVETPGGRESTPLWESVVGQGADAPGRFLERLLARDDGRTAFFYDAVARLDPARQRFALGLGQGDVGKRGERFRALAAVFARGEAWWRPEAGPFNRSGVDAATMLRLVRVDASGLPTRPAGRALWEAAFADGVTSDPAALRPSEPVGAAWLAERIGQGPQPLRRERLVKLAFAQRVFGAAADETSGEVLWALRGLGREPALALTLERMGLTAPRSYAEAVRKAEEVASTSDRGLGPVTMALFQGALALIERARLRHTIDVQGAESLLRSLVAVPVSDGRYGSGIARWLRKTALPAFASATYGSLPPGSDEEVVARTLAGAVLTRPEAGRAFEWEGLFYRADVGEAERRRLEQVRRRQGGNSLDAVLEFSEAVDDLEWATGAGGVAAGVSKARAAARGLEPAVYPGGEALDVRALVASVEKDDAGTRRLSSHALARMQAAGERLLADALLSLAYAPHLGPPDGPVLAGGNVALRHRFGPASWAVAEETTELGAPWHVRGALVGLDGALAGLSLRRLSPDPPLRPPGLDGRARLAFARLVTLMVPVALEDGDQAAIAAAIERGRGRAARLASAPGEAGEAAREAALDAWRAQALNWVIAHEPAALPRFFSLLELLRLGRPGPGGWDGWGGPSVGEDGAWRLRLPEPRPFDDLAGQQLEELLPARFADLGLRAALDLHARGLPAALAPGLLAYLVQDMVEGAEPRFHDDWLALVRFVQDIKAERVDDIVSAQAGGGALLPAPEPSEAR